LSPRVARSGELSWSSPALALDEFVGSPTRLAGVEGAAPNRRVVAAIPETGFPSAGVDALPPAAMARRAAEVGHSKAALGAANTLALAGLAGAFIAMGAVFATTVTAGAEDMPYGVARLLGGVTFSLGLILVVVAGAERFGKRNAQSRACRREGGIE
jgi:Formate/nitrite transporter